jgi:hypothetical protein
MPTELSQLASQTQLFSSFYFMLRAAIFKKAMVIQGIRQILKIIHYAPCAMTKGEKNTVHIASPVERHS